MSQNLEPDWLPAPTYDRVVVLNTARLHGGRPRRLPDRIDPRGAMAAVLVDDPGFVEEVFRQLDRPGRTVYVDVERKQAVDLFAIAARVMTSATLAHIKPNDVTVRSLDVLVKHLLGSDLRTVNCGVYGTGNLGFKIALLLAECNARVFVAARSEGGVHRTVGAINAILPRHHEQPVRLWSDDVTVDLFITAVTARGAVGSPWIDRLAPGAHVIDVGIDNLDGAFVAQALASGITVNRLDTRAAESQVVGPAPGFFEDVFGSSMVGNVPVVSGGCVRERGVVVVDNLTRPTLVLGVANGLGGLVPASELTPVEMERVADVKSAISRG